MNMDKKIEDILPFVERPSRYIGQESGIYPLNQKENHKIKICMCFPDLYEIGMSYLGMKILYGLLDSIPDVLVDLVFMPKEDYIKISREEKIPLCSLERKIPLKEFDIIGFSLSYELCYTNVLEILDLAQIPIHSKNRFENYPLVISGGGCTVNPEVMSKFIDAFVLGDGEETILDIVNKFKDLKKSNREKQLEELAFIDGVYIPSFYEFTYDGEKIKSVNKIKNLDIKPKQRIVKDLDKIFYPEKPIVPYVDIVHNHLSVEVQRGCFWGCKFCQASYINRPVRIRREDKIKNLIDKGLDDTGYSEVSLLSLSIVDYPKIDKILKWFVEKYYNKRFSISLPSLRCDKFSLSIAGLVNKNRKSSLTFAPEAGTQRLRDFIGKDLNETDIFGCIEDAYKSGWKLVKLYFMYGLPSETMEDIEGIVNLIKKLKYNFKGMNFNVTISAFVPKSHTPFQWESQEKLADLLEKKYFLLKNLKRYANVKHSKLESTIVEGLLARGDRRIGDVVESAWKLGSKFDQWNEHFNFENWQKACIENNIDLEFYTNRKRDYDEILPWSHLEFSVNDKDLYKILNIEKINTIKRQEVVEEEPKAQNNIIEESSNNKHYTYRVSYKKESNIRFVSHLEIVASLRRILIKSKLPLLYSQGFHPLPKISFGEPLSVGFMGDDELFDFELLDRMDVNDVKNILDKVVFPGIKINYVKILCIGEQSLDKTIKYLEYKIDTLGEFLFDKKIIEDFLKQDKHEVTITIKEKERHLDLRAIINFMELNSDGVLTIKIDKNIYKGSLFPILNALFNFDLKTFNKFLITRTKNIINN
jgi:radical SAM family uncharacterized protein/radical SAM-linked protein